MNAMIRDPFRSKRRSTGNLGMTTSKASLHIFTAMWSLRPQVISCLKIKMLWERKMTNLISQSIIRVYGMRTIYVHKVIAKISQQNGQLLDQAINESSLNSCHQHSSLTVFNKTFSFSLLVILFSDFVLDWLRFHELKKQSILKLRRTLKFLVFTTNFNQFNFTF